MNAATLTPVLDRMVPTRKTEPYWVFGLVAIGILAIWPRAFPLDDAYITMHNARSLLAGGDPLFGVHPLVGATSAVHLACVAALGLFLPLPTAALGVSALCAAVYACGLWKLRPHWTSLALGLSVAYVPIQLLNGLETSMAMAAVVWAFVLRDDRRLSLLLGLMPFIRPDLVFLAAPLAMRQIRSDPLRVIGFGLLTSVPFAAWVYLATGVPFPGTAEAKVLFFAQYADPFLWKLTGVLKAVVFSFLILVLPGLFGLTRLRAGWCGLIYLGAVLGISLASLPGALYFNDYRYLAPMVPILVYGLTTISGRVLDAVAALALVTGAVAVQRLHDELSHGMDTWFDGAQAVAALPKGSTVLIHDVGIVAWANPQVKLIDVVGLKTPSSIESMKRHDVRPCRWGPALTEIARNSEASYIAVLEEPFWNCVRSNLQDEGWSLTPTHRGTISVYRLGAPQNRSPGS